ncbi:MAG: hypothetical protein ACOVO0_14420, partial [Burkholderiaceae bacterium]
PASFTPRQPDGTVRLTVWSPQIRSRLPDLICEEQMQTEDIPTWRFSSHVLASDGKAPWANILSAWSVQCWQRLSEAPFSGPVQGG